MIYAGATSSAIRTKHRAGRVSASTAPAPSFPIRVYVPSLLRVVVIVVVVTAFVGMFRPILMLVRILMVRVFVLMVVIAMPVFVRVLNPVGMLVCMRVFVFLHCFRPLLTVERGSSAGANVRLALSQTSARCAGSALRTHARCRPNR